MKILLIFFVLLSIFFGMFVNTGFSENDTVIVINEKIILSESDLIVKDVLEINEKEMKIETYEKSELDKLFEIMREKEETTWRQGDILIASATTLAFFGFASFLTAQFRGKNQDRSNFLSYIDMILISIFVIQIVQLFTISIIVIGVFHWFTYLIIIIITGLSLLNILINSRKIITLQNSREIKMTDGTYMVKQAKEKYTHKMLRKAKEANKELEKLRKKKPE